MNMGPRITLAIFSIIMNIQFDPTTKRPKLSFSKENDPPLFLQSIKADKKLVCEVF